MMMMSDATQSRGSFLQELGPLSPGCLTDDGLCMAVKTDCRLVYPDLTFENVFPFGILVSESSKVSRGELPDNN